MPAFLLSPLIRWAAVAIAIGVFFGLWRWDAHELSLKTQELTDARQDAKRWHDASDLRGASITVLNATLSKQNTAIEAQRADDSRRDIADAERSRQTAQDAAALDARVKELEAEVAADPGGVREVGPIVKKRIEGLWQ